MNTPYYRSSHRPVLVNWFTKKPLDRYKLASKSLLISIAFVLFFAIGQDRVIPKTLLDLGYDSKVFLICLWLISGFWGGVLILKRPFTKMLIIHKGEIKLLRSFIVAAIRFFVTGCGLFTLLVAPLALKRRVS